MKRLLLLLILLLVACTVPQSPWETMQLKTSDNIRIAADFYKADSDKGVILLHMLNRAKSDWREFAIELQGAGYNVIAIDFRGHGDSEASVSQFTESNFNSMVEDVAAAKAYLESVGISKIGIVGASIGANTALNYAADDPEIKTIVLLSPGLDYRGIKTEGSILKYDRSIFMIASRDDETSLQSSDFLYKKASGKKQMQIYDDAGHGTRMLAAEPDLRSLIRIWLDEQLK